jgi:hypothetical protein
MYTHTHPAVPDVFQSFSFRNHHQVDRHKKDWKFGLCLAPKCVVPEGLITLGIAMTFCQWFRGPPSTLHRKCPVPRLTLYIAQEVSCSEAYPVHCTGSVLFRGSPCTLHRKCPVPRLTQYIAQEVSCSEAHPVHCTGSVLFRGSPSTLHRKCPVPRLTQYIAQEVSCSEAHPVHCTGSVLFSYHRGKVVKMLKSASAVLVLRLRIGISFQ